MGTREQNREQREQTLVRAAVEVIAERGLSSVRMSDIAERAGMTTGHVSYYFPLKSELLRRAIESSEQALIAEAQQAMAGLDDPVLKLEMLLDLSLADGPADPGWLLWFQVWAEAALDADIAQSHHLLDGEWRTLLQAIVAEGAATGAFHAPDFQGAVTAIASMIDGLSIQLAVGSPGYTAEQIRAVATASSRALLGVPQPG